MSRSLIFCATKISDCIGILTGWNCKYKNIKLNDSAAPIGTAEIFMHFCFYEFMFTDILYSAYITYLQVLFKPKELTDYSNSLLFQLVKLFYMLHALVAVENVFCPFTVNFKKAL